MFDTVIISGGNIEDDFALAFLEKEKQAVLAAADGGLKFCKRNGIVPSLVMGDFDSVAPELVAFYEGMEKVELIRLCPQKDDADTQSLFKLVKERGARKVAILGGTGTRLDHVFANLELLAYGKAQGVDVVLVDRCNWISVIESGTIVRKEEQFGTYISFFPLGGDVQELTLEGFQYPLDHYLLRAVDGGLTVSNELAEEEGRITFRSGILLMMMTRD